jgi:hypothetical protein
MEIVQPAGFAGLRQRFRQCGGRRLYRCEHCRWRGYISRARIISPWFWLLVAAVTGLVVILLVL